HRAHGSRAWHFVPPGLLVAHPPQRPRKTEGFRTDPLRFPHERPYTFFQQRALQIAAAVCRRELHHDHHRFHSTQLAPGDDPRWEVLVLQPDHSHAHYSQPLPHRCSCRLEYLPLAAFRTGTAEVCICEFRRAVSSDDGKTGREPE